MKQRENFLIQLLNTFNNNPIFVAEVCKNLSLNDIEILEKAQKDGRWGDGALVGFIDRNTILGKSAWIVRKVLP